MTALEICSQLCSLGGTSGNETQAANKAKQLLQKYMPSYIDNNGNVIGEFTTGGSYTVALEAHLDMVGLVVTEIDEDGFIHFDKVGGTDVRTLTGAFVTVFGKTELDGVVCSKPPHLLTENDKKSGVNISNLTVDVGLNCDEVKSVVSVGDRMIVRYEPKDLLNNRFTSCALDDRSGIAAILLALDMLTDKLKNVNIKVIFSCGEEVGGFGAQTAAFNCNLDEAICVDVGFGSDKYCSGEGIIDLGKGASIGISPLLDRSLMLELKRTAEENGIPYQHDVMSGLTGTNADKFTVSKGGVKTALLSIPLRNMHTPVEVIDMGDVVLTAELISRYLLKKEAEQNA